MLLDQTAQGVFAIAVTPFTPEGAVDYASVDSMTDFYLRSGVTELTILGRRHDRPAAKPSHGRSDRQLLRTGRRRHRS
jgi:4-hydroxy-tetrahydrodipicolinate synthase